MRNNELVTVKELVCSAKMAAPPVLKLKVSGSPDNRKPESTLLLPSNVQLVIVAVETLFSASADPPVEKLYKLLLTLLPVNSELVTVTPAEPLINTPPLPPNSPSPLF